MRCLCTRPLSALIARLEIGAYFCGILIKSLLIEKLRSPPRRVVRDSVLLYYAITRNVLEKFNANGKKLLSEQADICPHSSRSSKRHAMTVALADRLSQAHARESSTACQTLFVLCEHGGRYNNVGRSLENRGATRVAPISALGAI
jgi:hypothetical protein